MADESYDYDANCRRWPDVAGAFPIGSLEFEIIDPIRNSQYAPEPTVTRRLYVRAWYPARDVSGCSRRPYFTQAEVDTVPAMSLALLRQPPNALRNAVGLPSNSFADAPPADGKFPVAVFNHGYLSYPAQHTALFEHLAANGYVVLSVGHPWESGGIVYPNGDVVVGSPRILEDMMRIGQALGAMAAYAAPTLGAQLDAFREYVKILRTTSAGRLAPVWRDDVYFVLDRLEDDSIPAASSVAAMIDHERRAYMGKSFGAYIA
jgi:predicted dienelactone hydrolase